METVSKIIVKWSGKEYEITITENDTIADLKQAIEKATGVRPDRQKLLNLKLKGKTNLEFYFHSAVWLVSVTELSLRLVNCQIVKMRLCNCHKQNDDKYITSL